MWIRVSILLVVFTNTGTFTFLRPERNLKMGFKTNILIRENRQLFMRKKSTLHTKIKIIKIKVVGSI
jgi:hypothetical protein